MPTLTLKAVADDRMYIWHAYFGVSGCKKDLNVLEGSPLHSKVSTGAYPPALAYELDGALRHCVYWLVDSIYPLWPYFVYTVLDPKTEESKHVRRQEGKPNDTKRAFDALKEKFQVLKILCRYWSVKKRRTVILASVALHNMAVDELDSLETMPKPVWEG